MREQTYPDILVVDSHNKPLGGMQLPRAIADGKHLRLVRVLLKNLRGELLLQKRAPHVMVPNLWNETAAGHVDHGDTNLESAKRELAEEMGISGVTLHSVATYYQDLPTKYGLGHYFTEGFIGRYNGEVHFDTDEVADYKWISQPKLTQWLVRDKAAFTSGFRDFYEAISSSIAKL